MLVNIHEGQFLQLRGAADTIYRFLAFAEGQSDSYAAKREEWAFPAREQREEPLPPFPRTLGNTTEKAETVFCKFTDKELAKMPKFFRTDYKLKGGTAAHIRQKPNGTFEIRYRRNGFNISVSSKNLGEAKERFIQALCAAKTDAMNDKTFFGQYATQWLEVVKKPQVKENTWNNYIYTLKTYVFPKFGKMRLRDIKPTDVQKLLNGLEAKGLQRSVENVYTILKPIFDFAVAEDLLVKNPMAIIRKPKYETKHGKAFTVQEERDFVAKCISGKSPCRYAYILMIFTGIRRSELASAEISPQWVTVVTAKGRKGEAPKKRKIPVSPMLMPFLPFMTKENLTVREDTLTREISKFIEGHHLHELRHTFITRCQECGISRELTSVWAGHKADNTMTSNVYTHFSEEFQIGEIQKLRY